MLFPLFSITYIIAPHSRFGLTMRKPFIKFICHSASYFTFLCKYFSLPPSPSISPFLCQFYSFAFPRFARVETSFFFLQYWLRTRRSEKKNSRDKTIVVRAVHGDDKQNNNNINNNGGGSNNKMENERKVDHYLITFSNYTHFSNILFHCECAISPNGTHTEEKTKCERRRWCAENRHLSPTYIHRVRRMMRTHEINTRTNWHFNLTFFRSKYLFSLKLSNMANTYRSTGCTLFSGWFHEF